MEGERFHLKINVRRLWMMVTYVTILCFIMYTSDYMIFTDDNNSYPYLYTCSILQVILIPKLMNFVLFPDTPS